jgi:D-beta-D-heptose 7-phosphate kinase/D-beta-D-heptose 1-phosphate adenosyltransferase
MENRLQKLITLEGKKPKICVIGDVLLDKYLWASINRICPEAPCPIALLDHATEDYRLGGAANVAHNLVKLGAEVELLGVTGIDENADVLESLAREKNCLRRPLIRDFDRPTVTKTRILSKQHSQIAIRLDEESKVDISDYILGELKTQIEDCYKDIGFLVISDYGKGVVTKDLIDFIHSLGLHKKTLVDPNSKNLKLYRGFYLLKPNVLDLETIYSAINNQLTTIRQDLGVDNLIVTMAKDGALLHNELGTYMSKAVGRAVVDVTGAGDTTTAALAYALGCGMNIKEALDFSMFAAAIVVKKQGTSTTTLQEILELVRETK